MKVEWIDSKNPPDESGSYIVCTERGAVCTAHYYKKNNHWSGTVVVDWWMPLPPPPKGARR